MRTVILMIAIAAGASGCTSPGLPSLGDAQEYGYPVTRSALPPVVAPTPAPVAARDAAATATPSKPAVPASREAALPTAEPAAEAPYDDSKDPYVTAVLLPPVSDQVLPDLPMGADGKPAPLAPPAKLDIIDVRDNLKALTSEEP